MFIRLIPSDSVSFCISQHCECLFFSEVWNWYLDPRCRCYILHEQLTFITAQPQCCFSCSRFSVCGKYCLILSWRRPPVCLCRAAWGRGVQLWSEGEEIWGTPGLEGTSCLTSREQRHCRVSFWCFWPDVASVQKTFSVWFSSRISFKNLTMTEPLQLYPPTGTKQKLPERVDYWKQAAGAFRRI